MIKLHTHEEIKIRYFVLILLTILPCTFILKCPLSDCLVIASCVT
jgi:hypothetical protein